MANFIIELMKGPMDIADNLFSKGALPWIIGGLILVILYYVIFR